MLWLMGETFFTIVLKITSEHIKTLEKLPLATELIALDFPQFKETISW